jgi:allantoate deiminase
VGHVVLTPNAPNVIAGGAAATIDVRSPVDADRGAAVAAITASIRRLCAARRVNCSLTPVHAAPAADADWALTSDVAAAAAASERVWRRAAGAASALSDDPTGSTHVAPAPLVSGAGHDALAVAAVAPWAMLFVRDEAGVSHSPAERVRVGDVAAAAAALAELVAGHVV